MHHDSHECLSRYWTVSTFASGAIDRKVGEEPTEPKPFARNSADRKTRTKTTQRKRKRERETERDRDDKKSETHACRARKTRRRTTTGSSRRLFLLGSLTFGPGRSGNAGRGGSTGDRGVIARSSATTNQSAQRRRGIPANPIVPPGFCRNSVKTGSHAGGYERVPVADWTWFDTGTRSRECLNDDPAIPRWSFIYSIDFISFRQVIKRPV